MSKYRTKPVNTTRMPPGIPFIIGNEAAERFSFYGMKTILAVFMTKYLHLMGSTEGKVMSETLANEKVHLFNSAVYITPLLGAFLCDALLGKYRTIIWLSLVYCMGHAALAVMGEVGEAAMWMFAGLFLISMGAGGIKPCVSAHVGDQFGRANSHLLPRIYNFFYFSINVGAFLSTMMTPWLLKWFGPHWAFGTPGVLMALATVVFWMGRNRFAHVPARGEPFVRELFSRDGIFAIGKLFIIFIFVAVFWALFDQTGSSWIFQAQDMDRNFLGFEWLESQIQAVNPILILLFIPIFTFVIYPTVDKFFKLTPLRKISIGLFLMAGGFSIVANVQEWIDAGERPSIAWQILAYALLTAAEVMVSIVCLEFSYTQAPAKMKSVIMAFFLASVSLGNLFTAGVNHFIQVPAVFEGADEALKELQLHEDLRMSETRITHKGHDDTWNTADDVTAVIKGKSVGDIQFAGREVLEEAVLRIEAFADANGSKLPLPDAGAELISELQDPYGSPLRYRLMNSKQFRVSSDGPDKKFMTKWDVGYIVMSTAEDPEGESLFDMMFAFMVPEDTWLDVRKAELAAKSEDDGAKAEGGSFEWTAFAGGQTTLEGADYFWFFTWLMFGTAIVFVLVAVLYRPKTYLQDAEEVGLHEEAEAEGTR